MKGFFNQKTICYNFIDFPFYFNLLLCTIRIIYTLTHTHGGGGCGGGGGCCGGGG